MIQTFRNAWKIADIRKKLLFTLFIVLIYRIGANLYVPFVDTDQLLFVKTYQNAMSAGIFQLVNMFSGGAFEQATLFALSVSPYITASIVMQLLTIAIPYLENLSKEGEEGKKKINAYTRVVTAILAVITAFGYVTMLNSYGCLAVSKSDGALYYFAYVVMIACFCAGAAIIMWMAERINEKGIGNGISIILFANIISRGSTMVSALIALLKDANGQFLSGWRLALGILWIILFVAVAVAVVGLIVWFTNSEERIRIQYAKKVVGRKMYGGQTSNLPLKMNMAGVMPIIFASSIVSILPTIANFFGESNGFRKFVTNYLGTNTPVYILLYLVFLFLFSYFYIMISFNPVEVANNIQNNGGSIKGYRPGAETANYIKRHLNRITAIGAVFLSVIACVPMIVGVFVTNTAVSTLLTFGGSSLLIVVGVALETVRSVEAQMKLRNYKGFLD
ncbi:MAG TPA: preprotein translocase subunit SecY [Clostridiales bacterium]|nr:preprotein translocase subunit SecY [Clostridiales bacterium]